MVLWLVEFLQSYRNFWQKSQVISELKVQLDFVPIGQKNVFIHIFNRVSLIIDSVRGVLGSTLVLSCNMGILLSFIFGHFFQFYVTPIIAIAFTVVFVVSLFFFPESPLVLMKQNKLSVC